MKIAIVHERFPFHFERAAASNQRVLNVSGVFALAHPDAFFQKRIGEGVSPNRRRSFHVKIFDEEKAWGFDSAAGPAMGGKEKTRAVVMNVFVDGGDQLCATHRGPQRGKEQPGVTRSLAPRNGAGRVSADSIGNEPLA